MRKQSLALAVSFALTASAAWAENILRVQAPVSYSPIQSWAPGENTYSPWRDVSVNCGQWSPSPSAFNESAIFTQSQSCTKQQQRDVQKTLVSNTGVSKPDGESFTEEQNVSSTDSRDYKVDTTTWTEQAFSCTAWTPDPSTVNEGSAFTQTANDCVVQETRIRTESFKNADASSYTDVSQMTENRELTAQTKTRESVGTKALSANYMKVVNPVPGVNGIYTIDAGTQGTFSAYVDMTTDGGHWILVAHWAGGIPNSSAGRTHKTINVKGQAISGYTSNSTSFPIIKDGIINTAEYGMLKNGNATWTSTYGSWQVMATVDSTFVYGSAGFPVRTSTGATKTMWHKGGGWGNTESAMSTDYFGFNMAWGAGGPCGGAGVTGSKVCPYLFTSYPYHFDFSATKQYYLKASRID